MHTWATTIMLRWLLGCYVIIIICKQCPVIILHCDNITSLVWSILQYLGRHNEETILQTRSIAHQLHSNVVRAVKVSDYFSSRVFSFMFQDFLSQLHPWAQQQLDCSEPKHKSMKQLPISAFHEHDVNASVFRILNLSFVIGQVLDAWSWEISAAIFAKRYNVFWINFDDRWYISWACILRDTVSLCYCPVLNLVIRGAFFCLCQFLSRVVDGVVQESCRQRPSALDVPLFHSNLISHIFQLQKLGIKGNVWVHKDSKLNNRIPVQEWN